MRKRLRGIEGGRILQGALKGIIATAIMGLALWAWLGYFGNRSAWIVGAGGIAVGGIIYGVMMLILRVQEVRDVLTIARRKLKGAIG